MTEIILIAVIYWALGVFYMSWWWRKDLDLDFTTFVFNLTIVWVVWPLFLLDGAIHWLFLKTLKISPSNLIIWKARTGGGDEV